MFLRKTLNGNLYLGGGDLKTRFANRSPRQLTLHFPVETSDFF